MRSPSVASKEWVYRQYDHMVRIGTAVRPGQGDAAVVRFTGQREGGVALSHEATAESLMRTIHAHPTLYEALGEAEHAADHEDEADDRQIDA